MRRSPARAMALSAFIVIISIFNFLRLTGGECIRAIHIVTLLVCGMGIGVFISALIMFLRKSDR
jgi:hypothetical protein